MIQGRQAEPRPRPCHPLVSSSADRGERLFMVFLIPLSNLCRFLISVRTVGAAITRGPWSIVHQGLFCPPQFIWNSFSGFHMVMPMNFVLSVSSWISMSLCLNPNWVWGRGLYLSKCQILIWCVYAMACIGYIYMFGCINRENMCCVLACGAPCGSNFAMKVFRKYRENLIT
jgi:hypothetical protein